ncbi:MAG: hypothetical protein ACT4PM_09060 [Gemmatimonadales bacterium]
MPISPLIALVALVAWIVLVFVRPIGLGIVHLLLALAAILFIRWWALRKVRSET